MPISAEILADSTHTLHGRTYRVTSFKARYSRIVLAEVNTHRMLSRNSASSRAIPVERMIADVVDDPAMPLFWGKNQKGMAAAVELDADEIVAARAAWLEARDRAVESVQKLLRIGLHKQNANRLLEPWMYTTSIITATDLANFYHLRRDAAAQPEIHALADAMWEAQQASTPIDRTGLGDADRWHLPLVNDEEREEFGDLAVKVSTGRCARVSYLTFEGKRDPNADIELHDRLAMSGHWSPFEHQARPGLHMRYGNFSGWIQYRKTLPTEHPYRLGQVEP